MYVLIPEGVKASSIYTPFVYERLYPRCEVLLGIAVPRGFSSFPVHAHAHAFSTMEPSLEMSS